MSEDIIETLLSGRLADPDGGPPLCVPTRAVAIADSLAGREAELVAGLDFGPRLALVSDVNTHEALGERVARVLAGKVDLTQIRMTGRPHADAVTVAAIRRESSACDALVAVGSGTINDLCNYAAARDGKEYAVFATAPSMNGYTSLNASITLGGHKKSLPAVAAAGVFLDLEVLSKAPARTHAGAVGLRHDHLRRQPAGEPGRAPDRPHRRDACARRLAADLPRRASGSRDADHGPAAGTDAGRRATAARSQRGQPGERRGLFRRRAGRVRFTATPCATRARCATDTPS